MMTYNDFAINLVVEQMTEIWNKKSTPKKLSSVIWSVMEGGLQGEFDGLPGWEDLTVSQIAAVLDVTNISICDVLWRIRKKTGYTVPHVISPSGWAARNARRREAGK